jgi:predicted nucleic acid-binding protein
MDYFDTSFLVPFFVAEPASDRVEQLLKRQTAGESATSRWTRVEFSAAIARQVRIGRLGTERARQVEAAFDELTTESFAILSPAAADFEVAQRFLRRYETGLRAGDALHLAIANNHAAMAIYSLDEGMLKAGRLLGLPVKSGIRLP